MKTSVKILIVVLLVLDIALAVLVFGPIEFGLREEAVQAPTTQPATEAVTVPAETQPPQTAPAPTETEQTLPPETTQPTEPTQVEKNTFTLTFAGDCTLGTTPGTWKAKPGFVMTVGNNLSYPFKSMGKYFQEDDFSLVNLEGPLTPDGTPANGKTSYRGPVEYVSMLTDNGIEAVSLANDHIMDYGDAGYASTLSTLTNAGVSYVEKNAATLVTTDSGLTIGLYALLQKDADEAAMTAAIADLKAKGAELVIVAGHWGVPGNFNQGEAQRNLAHAAIDAGAKIVVGTHPHVLQPIEEYGDGIIYYSLGRFVFGGASISTDWDTAIIQQEVDRNDDGTISLGEMKAIPASLGNKPGVNNYQPTPYSKGDEGYGRVMKKLGLN